MTEKSTPKVSINIEEYITTILSTIEREREREIISRRFGLFDRKETLEQIGELLGITRERVRQLEKSVVMRLKSTGENLPHVKEIQKLFLDNLNTMGKAARVSDLTARLTPTNTRIDQARVAFLAELCPKITIIEENDFYYYSVGMAEVFDEKTMKDMVGKIVAAIQKLNEPATVAQIGKETGIADTKQVEALASVSKQLATLNDRWGLVKWPMVNPKNIRDKIYVILKQKGRHMHFNEIAETIKRSDFKRKDVTTQAIHNELIKDDRFVLIGRGIYALKEWGYKKGTVSDIITEVLREAGEPLHRDEIVKRVLKSRYVKETTILLNLQGKSQFKRVAKATYGLTSATE
jgi:DNA-binding phage protein